MKQDLYNVILKSGKDASVKRWHPWVFSGAVKKIKNAEGREAEPKDGDLVYVTSNKDEVLGVGHYQNGSIMVRIITFNDEVIDEAFWTERIKEAYELRKIIGLTTSKYTNIYRLIHAEGDGLPGLIIDYYNGTAVIQSHSVGMHYSKGIIVDALKLVYGDELVAVYDKSADTLPKHGDVTAENKYLYQASEPNLVAQESDCNFKIDWLEGQKTGFFVDQRDNRALLGSYSKGKNVLNTFCYTGGFSVLALKNGANLVHSVDASKRAIDLTDENVKLNNLEKNHESYAIDTFKFFENTDASIYDIIILDPPAFAKHQNVKHNAVQGYKRLNATAMQHIKPGGIIFTFSCSQVVDNKLFYNTIMSAAIQVGRKVKVLHQLTQPADHPINIFHPESNYLKGLVIQVL
jgi:23S rRNA (cytosine1962-C5)-methyltransferase